MTGFGIAGIRYDIAEESQHRSYGVKENDPDPGGDRQLYFEPQPQI